MCSFLYNWYYGYCALETINRHLIKNGTTHVLLIKGISKIKVRKYKDLYNFNIINLNKIELYYNNITDRVISEDYTIFNLMTLPEFINYVLPKNDLEIFHITVETYINNSIKHDFFEKVYINDGYMCKCRNSNEDCAYHELISENLYKKYIKNDSSPENTNICNQYDDDWRVV
jgi:hypothetical protein